MKVMEKNRSESAKRSRNNTPVSTPSSGNIAHNILNKSESRIHVGSDYQASLPEYNLSQSLDSSAEPRLLWAPSTEVNDVRVEEFLKLAKSTYGYNTEQALGMLFWHKWDFDAALMDMKNFAPVPDEWPVEDKVQFEQAFISHGKNFRKLQRSMPEKSVADLVKYYYLWKCRLLKEKYFRRQNKEILAREAPMETANDVNEFSDSDEDNRSDKDDSSKSQPAGATRKRADKVGRSKDKVTVLPKGIYMDMTEATDMLKSLSASQPFADLDPTWKQKTDAEQNLMSQQIKTNKQNIANLKSKASLNINKFRFKQDSSKITSTWTSDELLLAVQGLRMYGKDFSTIAEVIGTKTAKHVRDFFVTYQRRFNLDDILDEFYKEQRVTAVREDSQMEVEPLDGLAMFTQAPPPLVRQAPLPSQSISSSHLSVSQPPPLIKPDGFLLKPNNHA